MNGIAWGIVAWALIGGDGPEPTAARPKAAPRATYTIRIAGPGAKLPGVGRLATNAGIGRVEPEQVSYEVRVLTTPAGEWREAYYRHCTRVGREGRSTVWTIDEKTAAMMLDKQLGSLATRMIAAPKVTAFAGAKATVSTKQPRSFVVDVDRVADGPVDQAGAIALRPSAEEVVEGVAITVAGRRTAAGVRAHVNAESTWVGHVAKATTSETIQNKAYGKTTLNAPLELPQVVEAKLDGDYEIPAGRQLLASLGTATTVDGQGKPVVMERLLLIAARPILTEAEESAIPTAKADGAVRAAAMESSLLGHITGEMWERSTTKPAEAPRRMPPLPSRTPMQPIGPDGKVVELPPLPDNAVTEAEAVEPSSTPQPSPQARTTPRGTRFDPKVAPARNEPEPEGVSTVRLDSRQLASGRSQVVRIPLGAGLSIEVQARVVANDRGE